MKEIRKSYGWNPSLSKNSKPGKINWDEIKNQLEMGEKLLDSNWLVPIEQKMKILKDRAKKFAKESSSKVKEAEDIEIIQFTLAYELYGIETLYVQEVFPLKRLTPLPSTPAFLLGITNVRGKILPVIDIKKFFNLPDKGLTDLNKLIILYSDGFEFAILADLIIGAVNIDLTKLQPALPTLTGIRADFLKGVTNDGIIILDGEKISRDKRIIINDEL
ncbi:MAG: chemotaxis protein CheW [Ignavibacteriaceae bacterium]